MPHGAHVPRRGPPARCAPHDPGRHPGRGGRGARRAPRRPARGLHRHPGRHGRAARDGAPARPAAARVPSLHRGVGAQGGHGRAQPRGAAHVRGGAVVARVQPHARHPRRAARGDQARPLCHAGAGADGGRPPAGGRRRPSHRRDHDPADHRPRRAGAGPGLGRGRRGRGEQGARSPGLAGRQGGRGEAGRARGDHRDDDRDAAGRPPCSRDRRGRRLLLLRDQRPDADDLRFLAATTSRAA